MSALPAAATPMMGRVFSRCTGKGNTRLGTDQSREVANTSPKCPHGVDRRRHPHAHIRGYVCCQGAAASPAIADIAFSLPVLQYSTEAIGAWVEGAHPLYYLVYFVGAGIGFPFSEDAMVVWIGSQLAKGKYGSWEMNALVLAVVYTGVVISDMLLYWLGRLLECGLFPWLRERLLSDPKTYDRAVASIQRTGKAIGAVQRFSIGFRGPLCAIAGFTKVPQWQFFLGACIGAFGSIALQLSVGYLMRNTSNVYLAALAMVAGPNLIGHVLGPIAAGVGLVLAGRKNSSLNSKPPASPSAPTSTPSSP